MLIRTTDNTNGQLEQLIVKRTDDECIEDAVRDLHIIAAKKLSDAPSLLFFPQDWQLGIDKSDKIFELDANGKLTTNNIMGFIGYNETTLSISSRFYPESNDYFLHYMLCKVLGINVVNLDFSKGTGDIHDFLPYLFPSYLQNALSQGLYKQYRRNHYNDANVKGVIDINRHIRINIPFAGKVAYTTREHSYDNPVTQLIRHSIEYLRTREGWHGILLNNADVRANVSQIEYATPTYRRNDLQKVIKANAKLVNHPYFTKYRDLQKLCLQILRREKTNFGERDKIHGLLFDGAWLWEEYVGTVLKEIGIEHRTTREMLFERDNVGKSQGIIPDFIKPDGNKSAKFIGDAKYKHIDKKNNREDYFQIITYMFRYSCKDGYIIFPYDEGGYDKENESDEFKQDSEHFYRSRKINIESGERRVIEFGLKIPQSSVSYKDFDDKIKKSEAKLKDIKLLLQ